MFKAFSTYLREMETEQPFLYDVYKVANELNKEFAYSLEACIAA